MKRALRAAGVGIGVALALLAIMPFVPRLPMPLAAVAGAMLAGTSLVLWPAAIGLIFVTDLARPEAWSTITLCVVVNGVWFGAWSTLWQWLASRRRAVPQAR